MFTVKLVEHNGHEIINHATEVWAEPNGEKRSGDTREMLVHARKPDGEVVHFGGYGTLYVMNVGGKTVATYWLGYGEAQGEQRVDTLLAQKAA